MNTIKTPQGPVELIPPTISQLQALRARLPLGIVQYGEAIRGARFGVVMKCGENEAYAVKHQPVEVERKHLQTCYTANSILIAISLRKYMEHGFAGLMMPCAYVRDKGPKGIEAGLAFFAAPDPAGKEALDFPHDDAFDNQFGTGFTIMLTAAIRAIQAASKDSGITLMQPIGLDIRPRSALETLGFSFLVLGPLVFCLKTHVTEQDPMWTCLRGEGIESVVHVPSVPAEIGPEEASIAKPRN